MEEEKEEAEFERKVAEEVEKRISEAADPALYGVGTDPVRQAGNNGRPPLFSLCPVDLVLVWSWSGLCAMNLV